MNRMMSVLALLAVMALAGAGDAADTPSAKAGKAAKAAKGWAGVVEKVDGSFIVVKKTRKGGKAGPVIRVATNEKTVVRIDGKAGKVGALEAGQKVRVMPATGPARRIEALSAAGAAKAEKQAAKQKKAAKAKKRASGAAKDQGKGQ
jgi:hypothetical protein